jgi:ribosomal-protein-alanine acetyltransferase
MFSVSPACLENIPAILAIERRVMPVPWNFDHFYQEFGKSFSQTFIVCSQSDVLGYVVFWKLFEEGEILNFGVDPDWQNQGAGSALYQQVKESCSRCQVKKIALHVRKTNHAAVHFYEMRGFICEQSIARFYSDQTDALRMVQNLEISS